MLLIGLSWLSYWLLQVVFSLDTLKAALVTAIIFILIGLFFEREHITSGWRRP